MMRKLSVTLLLIFLVILQLGCQTPEEGTPDQPPPQIEPTDVIEISTPSPMPSDEGPEKHLVICLPQEPQSLFWYGPSSVPEEAVLHGIYENDFTTLAYDYQAVGLERIPSFKNGDATLRIVPVNEGDRVVDADSQVITLESGSRVIDSEGNLRIYDGNTLMLNQLVVDFNMKQRTWSDGQTVTAADSVYSFQLMANPNLQTEKFLAVRTANYQRTGNLQIRWTGLPGFQPNKFQTYFQHPLPRHTWLDLELSDLQSAQVSGVLPVGDGPFQIVEWVPGESIRLEPNPFYYLTADGYPLLESVTYRFIANTNQRIGQLLAGECHVLSHDGLSPDLIPFFLEAEEEGLLQTSINPDRWGWELIFGINSWADYGDGNGRPDWFQDVRVRQAIAMCINRQDMVDSLYQGQSIVAQNYIPPIHPLSANDIASFPYDPNAADGLLDEAGYVDNNLDGIRENPQTNTEFSVTLEIGQEEKENRIAQMIAEDLTVCGIEIFIEEKSTDDQIANGSEEPVNGRQFDLKLSLFEAKHIPDCERFTSREISGPPDQTNPITDEPYAGWDGQNRSGWSNQSFDAICAAALSAQSGSPEERLNHQQAQRIFSTELPVLPLTYIPKITAMSPNVRNISNDPTQDSEFWNLFAISFADNNAP